MTDRQKEALRLRAEDLSFEEIAERMGCTRQNVQQLLEHAISERFKMRKWYRAEIIYPNIEKWARQNDLSLTDFSKLCGFPSTMPIRNLLIYGRDSKKNVIDAILKVTGMTYEQAFATKEGDNNGNDM